METMQHSRWPIVPLGDLISLKSDFFQIDDTEIYKLVTAQWHAGGIVPRIRPTKMGRDIKTKRQQRLVPGDLLVAEIDAKEGGFGIVPQSLDGAIVSSHYFVYAVDTQRVDLDYLDYWLRSGAAERQIKPFVLGSTNYAAIRSYHFPILKIPLPLLPVQRHIVAVLDRATELRRKCNEVDEVLEQVVQAAFVKIFGDFETATKQWEMKPFTTAVTMSPKTTYTPSQQISFVPMAALDEQLGDVSIYERAPTEKSVSGKVRFQENDVLFAKITPCVENRKVAIVSGMPTTVGMGSTEFYVLRPSALVDPLYLLEYLRQPMFRQQAIHSFTSSTGRKRVPSTFFKALQIPVPPLSLQQDFAQIWVNIYQQRIRWRQKANLLEEIYLVLLSRAFSGELTALLSMRDACMLTPRQELLWALAIYASATNGGSVSITPLMKQMFLWQQEQAPVIPLEALVLPYLEQPYVFQPYHYGPYSEEVASDLAVLNETGFLHIEELPRINSADNGRTVITPGDDNHLQEALLEELPENIRTSVQSIVQRYGGMVLGDLLREVYSRYPEYATGSIWRGLSKS